MNDDSSRRDMLAAVAHPSRMHIVLALAARERHVSELAGAVGLSQSCTTRHLQVLARAGVVQARRAGKRVMAGLARSEHVAGLLAWLEGAGVPAPGSHAAPAATRPARGTPRGSGAEPRRGRGTPASPRGARQDGLGAPRPGGAQATPAAGPRTQEQAHADPAASDTPAAVPAEPPMSSRARPGDLDDFLL